MYDVCKENEARMHRLKRETLPSRNVHLLHTVENKKERESFCSIAAATQRD
jgi:hypothetical protein